MHVDPPSDQKDYLHRAGRTARAGQPGTVVTLVLPRQRRRATAMLAKAGVTPTELRVRVGDPALAEVTGARQPSGVPVRTRAQRSQRGLFASRWRRHARLVASRSAWPAAAERT